MYEITKAEIVAVLERVIKAQQVLSAADKALTDAEVGQSVAEWKRVKSQCEVRDLLERIGKDGVIHNGHVYLSGLGNPLSLQDLTDMGDTDVIRVPGPKREEKRGDGGGQPGEEDA